MFRNSNTIQKVMKLTLAQAIAAAMNDYLETGSLNKHNPCIYLYAESYHYGSAMEPHDEIVWDMQEGLGSWTPEKGDDITAISEGAAESLAA